MVGLLLRERQKERKKDRDICLFREICILRERNHYANGLGDWASESGMLMNNFKGKKKESLLKVAIREKEVSEERERRQTLTVLTRPPPSQVTDADVALAWDTEPNRPFQALGDTVYSSGFPFEVSFYCLLAKLNPFSIFLFPFLLGSNGAVGTRLGRKWPQGMSVVGPGSFGSCLQNMPNLNPSCASCQPRRGPNKLHVALWKASSPRVAFLLSGWVNVPASLEANTQGAQTWMQCTGLTRVTLHFLLCFRRCTSQEGLGTGLALRHRWPSHVGSLAVTTRSWHRHPQLFLGASRVPREGRAPVVSFLFSLWPRESRSRCGWRCTCFLSQHWEDMDGDFGNFYLESTSHLVWTKTATQPHCSLKWLSPFGGHLGNDPWYG